MPELFSTVSVQRLTALFVLLDRPVSRRSLVQLMGQEADTLEESLDALMKVGCLSQVDASHWQRRSEEHVRSVRTRMLSEQTLHSEDLLLRVLLPESGRSVLERCTLLLDVLRTHARVDQSAAVQVCIDILLVLAADIPWTSLSDEEIRQYLQIVKHLQSISIMFSYRQSTAVMLLQAARQAALDMGDERNLIMLDLMESCQIHLSHMHNLASPHTLLRTVMERIQRLGDSDILTSTSTGVGLVYFMQGEYEKAIAFMMQCPDGFFVDSFDYLEEVRLRYMGSAACALGRLELGLAPMLASLFEARERDYRMTVKWHKVHLSDQLLRVGLLDQGMELLTEVLHCTDPESEIKLWFWTCRCLAYYHFQCGRIEVAHRILSEGMHQCIRYGAKRPYYGFTWIFEVLGTFRRLGLSDIPGYGYEAEIQAGLQSPNPLFRSAALRVHATTMLALGTPMADTETRLRRSLELAEEARGVLDAARSRLALARYLYSEGRRTEEADALYDQAWKTLRRFHQYDCPEPRSPMQLLPTPEELDTPEAETCLTRFSELLSALTDSESREDIFQNLMSALCAALGLERGCLFAVEGGRRRLVSSFYIPAHELEHDLRATIRSLFQTDADFCRVRNALGSALVLRLPAARMDGTDLCFFAYCRYLQHRIDLQERSVFDRIARIAAVELHKALLWYDKIHARENTALERVRQATEQKRQTEFFYGTSMQQLIQQVDTAARSDASILILGETGVGKEILARRIHAHSRRSGLFVAVNPAGMTESLFESECFGYEKGAFTGAQKQKIGLFELASQGTLFIDELGEIPLSLQVKLLRVLQEKAFLRIGGTQEIHSDFRLVTATNRDLKKMVAEGRFREDLYYRVAVIPISLPSLRQRREDIPMLARLFLQQYALRYQRTITDIADEEMEQLTKYPWPGNIRELKSVIERAVILSDNDRVHFDLTGQRSGADRPARQQQDMAHFFAALPTLDELEKNYIAYVLKQTRGRINGPGGALQILGMKRSTLYKKIREYQLDARSMAYGTDREAGSPTRS